MKTRIIKTVALLLLLGGFINLTGCVVSPAGGPYHHGRRCYRHCNWAGRCWTRCYRY